MRVHVYDKRKHLPFTLRRGFCTSELSLANYTLLFVWIKRHDHSVHITGTAALQWGNTFVGGCQWPIIELTKNVSPKNKMAASHVVQIHTHACAFSAE